MKLLQIFTIAAVSATIATAASAEISVERGSYLVNGISSCGNCHTPQLPDGSPDMSKFLAGGFEFNELPAFQAFSRNITPDIETGIGTWTEAEIVEAIRNGHTPEDEIIGPPMPIAFYRNFSDDDAASIAMYLKSIPAIRNEVPDATWNIPKPEFPPAPGGPTPSTADPVAYGDYLVNSGGHCFDCHTARNPDGSLQMDRLGAGGFAFAVLPNGTVYTANITSDVETGIGGWSDAAVARALTQGLSSNGHILFPAMPYNFLKIMTDEDIAAIIAYLRTIPPVSNDIVQVDWMAGFGLPPMQNAPPLP